MKALRTLLTTLMLIAACAGLAWAVVPLCSISGSVPKPDNTPCANCTITFTPTGSVPQIINGTPFYPATVYTTTDASGNLSPISLIQGANMTVTITDPNGQVSGPIQTGVAMNTGETIGQLLANNLLAPGVSTVSGLNVGTHTIVFANSPYTVLATDFFLYCDASGGNVTINLPVSSGGGRWLHVQKIDSSTNDCTVVPAGTDTINGAAASAGDIILNVQYADSYLNDGILGQWFTANGSTAGGVIQASGDLQSATRVVTDGVENTTTTLTSATANFTTNDVGASVTGSGIPASTTISSVTNGTTVILNNAETATATGVRISLIGVQPLATWVHQISAGHNITADIVGGPYGLIGYGAVNGAQYPVGNIFANTGYHLSTTAASTTIVEQNPTFTSTAVDGGKTILIYEAKKGPDWLGASQSCSRGTFIQPLTNNAGGFVYENLGFTTGTTGGSTPTFDQTKWGIVTDGSCYWVNTGDTGLILNTTIASITNSTTAVVVTAPDFTFNAGTGLGAYYIYGNAAAATTAIQAAITAAGQSGGIGGTGVIRLPCTSGPILYNPPIQIQNQGIDFGGCGWGDMFDQNSGGHNGGAGVLVPTAGGPAIEIGPGSTWGSRIHDVRIKGYQDTAGTQAIYYAGTTNVDQVFLTRVDADDGIIWNEQKNLVGSLQAGVKVEHNKYAIQFDFQNILIDGFRDFAYDLDSANTQGIIIQTQTEGYGGWQRLGASTTAGNIGIFDLGSGIEVRDALFLNSTGPIFWVPGDVLTNASITISNMSTDGPQRLVVCNGSAFGTDDFDFESNNQFYVAGVYTPTDGQLIQCGTGGPLRATFKFRDFKIFQHASPPALYFDVSAGATQSRSVELNNFTDLGVNLAEPNWVVNTSSTGQIFFRNCTNVANDQYCSQQSLNANNGETLNFHLFENPGVVQGDGLVQSVALVAPTVGNCTSGGLGAATCKYQITALVGGYETTPSVAINCTPGTSATDGQNNLVRISPPAPPGADTYNFYRNDCAGGSTYHLAFSKTASAMIFNSNASGLYTYDPGETVGGSVPPAINQTGVVTGVKQGSFGGLAINTTVPTPSATIAMTGCAIVGLIPIASGGTNYSVPVCAGPPTPTPTTTPGPTDVPTPTPTPQPTP